MEISDWRCWTWVALFLSLISLVSSSGYFELQILEISNTNNHLQSGYCCGLPFEKRNTQTTGCPACRTSFSLCLKEYQGSTSQQGGETSTGLYGCPLGKNTSQILGESSSFVLSDPTVGSIILNFSFRWTKSFTLILQALDTYNTSYPVSEQLIDEASFSGVILPSEEWHTLDHIGKAARITYRVRVKCATNYYNTTCTTFCRARDDRFGHYTCDDKGNKVCLSGWQGENCDRAICKPGCDPNHGHCDRPGECECRHGWKGPLCNECKVYPGCRHGSCNGVAWTCICDTNWGGILCDQDLNYCGTHEPCMHGGTCENTAPDQFRCTCAEGLSGTRCEIVEHPCAPAPCKNGGTCTLTEEQMETTTANVLRAMKGMSSMGKPFGHLPKSQNIENKELSTKHTAPQPIKDFLCSCAPGWTGPTCEINIDECAEGPCQNGGTCIDLVGKFRCECPPQWMGEICNIDVDECETNSATSIGPCINAESCENFPGSFECTCKKGWGGPTCAINIDDCIGKCKNGATCIDLVNDYHCACAVGYTGRDCSTDVNECANMPCRNGGECIDKIGRFECICLVGYSGTLCEEVKDHCMSSPCIEGSCLNTPDGYYCLCPSGRTGRHCELLKTPCDKPPCYDGCTPQIPINGTTSSNALITSSIAPCNGRGKCENSALGSSCVCQTGFTGTFCQHNLNECISNPCKNGGICIDGEADFNCECPPGWTGKQCNLKALECTPGQCQNGGSCIPSGIEGKSHCRCTGGWGGPFCNEPVDQCQGNPCHNGGTCESGPGWFRCVCARGFSGPDCRINVNECSPQPCLGGATCQDGIGGFTCICPPGRRGRRCEILLSDPNSVCSNTTTNSPYDPFNNANTSPINESNCNSCICINGKPRCSNLWCGLKNCLNKNNTNSLCELHQVCVPTSQENCLRPPCLSRGDCRNMEQSRRVAPPMIPAPTDCWPNQANLGPQCSRISILLETNRLAQGASVDGVCHTLRLLLGERLIRNPTYDVSAFIVLLCDIKAGSNDTIEVTLSTPTTKSTYSLPEAVKLLAEILSRQQGNLNDSFQSDISEYSILEVKVETALLTGYGNGSNYLIAICFGIAIVALCLGAIVPIIWRRKMHSSNSGVNLSVNGDLSRSHEEEKSNNLQNEENFRRYANPIKGSASSLRGAMELSLNPDVGQTPGPSSSLHRSQQLYPCDTDYEKEAEKTKSNRNSQLLLYKTQNADITKNIVSSIESPHKDFGKRSINESTSSANTTNSTFAPDSDILTVHV